MGMNQERLLQVILAPVVSEKSTMVAEKHQQVVFRVATDATKPEIKAAVEMLFNIKVEGVSTVNVKGKVKRFGRTFGRRKDWKKAYVSLVQGQEIDLTATPAAAE
ncbi:50S ribosomal protein L23 [Aquitalea sp. ASV15]|uniref:50S ribosomal protein L23 n=1 Tax=Aquitalea sp. ASV15 TaxID=2795104 RepID=UPI0018EDB5E7